MKKILFINASPNHNGNTARIGKELLEGLEYETLNLGDYRISQYGLVDENDQLKNVFDIINNVDILVVGTPVYWYSVSGIYKTFMDRWYMDKNANALKGKDLYFFAQGSGPSREAVDTITYLITRSSNLASLNLCGLTVNTGDVSSLREKLIQNKD